MRGAHPTRLAQFLCNGYIFRMSTAENPHDSVVRQTLGRLEVARGYFRHNLPEELLARLDLATLERVQDSFVDPELHPSASDLLFTVEYLFESDTDCGPEKLLLYLLIEHKSYPDRMALFQLLRYMVRIWELYCADNRRCSSLPLVYPMILYHGRKSWSYPLNFHSLFKVQDETLLRHLPEFSPVLHDVARSEDQEIAGETAARTLLLMLKYIFRPDLTERLPDLLVQARTLLTDENGREIMFTLLYYLTEGTGKVNKQPRPKGRGINQECFTVTPQAAGYQTRRFAMKKHSAQPLIRLLLEVTP